MGNGGPKFVLPLLNDPQKIVYKRSPKLPTKSTVAQTWKPFSWWIYVPWKTEVKKLPSKHQAPKEPWGTWSPQDHATSQHRAKQGSHVGIQVFPYVVFHQSFFGYLCWLSTCHYLQLRPSTAFLLPSRTHWAGTGMLYQYHQPSSILQTALFCFITSNTLL